MKRNFKDSRITHADLSVVPPAAGAALDAGSLALTVFLLCKSELILTIFIKDLLQLSQSKTRSPENNFMLNLSMRARVEWKLIHNMSAICATSSLSS